MSGFPNCVISFIVWLLHGRPKADLQDGYQVGDDIWGEERVWGQVQGWLPHYQRREDHVWGCYQGGKRAPSLNTIKTVNNTGWPISSDSLVVLTLIYDDQYSCPAAQPDLPVSYQPKLDWAEAGIDKIIVNQLPVMTKMELPVDKSWKQTHGCFLTDPLRILEFLSKWNNNVIIIICVLQVCETKTIADCQTVQVERIRVEEVPTEVSNRHSDLWYFFYKEQGIRERISLKQVCKLKFALDERHFMFIFHHCHVEML